MRIKVIFLIAALALCVANARSQPVPKLDEATAVSILKGEDTRLYDKTLEDLLKHPNADVRIRVLLAIGRIGDPRAIPAITPFLEKGTTKEREMAAFAFGEIEAEAAADGLIHALRDAGREELRGPIKARLIEAAGKIAAANPASPKTTFLRTAVIEVLNDEERRGAKGDRQTILLGLTAALRAASRDAKRERPDPIDIAVAKFLKHPDARVRADAANTLTRVRAKNANDVLRKMVATDIDPIARANGARALGAAEDKDALNLLIKAATADSDSRVRVSAIRAAASLKDAKVADELLIRGEVLLTAFKQSRFATRTQKSELLEIATALGRLLGNTNNAGAVRFLDDLRLADNYESPETEIAFAQVSPKEYFAAVPKTRNPDETFWQQARSAVQGLAELAKLPDKGNSLNEKEPPETFFRNAVGASAAPPPDYFDRALPDILRGYAAFKPSDLDASLRKHLSHADAFVRTAAAELLADQPVSKENIDALKTAFSKALLTDKRDNDAQLAMMDALHKLDKRASFSVLQEALQYQDYLVRRKALELLKAQDDWKDIPAVELNALREWAGIGKGVVWPYDPKSGTKLGQVLNTDADYRRALGRNNRSVGAILTTEKGTFTIDLLPEDAPLTVDNFIKLARSGYFNGLEVHRVVPNFVMQDGDPRGDGNGGPGWSIRCEINMVPYDRGAVGMALSGKDTGGSQWFVTHSPQPHLDGGYTVFGRVNESGMRVVDKIVRGDRILSVRIVEESHRGDRRRTRR